MSEPVLADLTVPVRELDGAPALAGLYGRAALGLLPLPRGAALPAAGLAVSGVRVDRAHLAAYDRVCGFRLADELPPTYPHLLVFALQTALMTGGDFPFPMIGLVHVANRITWSRPLHADESLVVRVHAANLRPHPRGTQFDMVSVALADGEPVWTEASTYLRRGRTDEPAVRDGEGTPDRGEPDAVWRLPSDTGRRYAAVSGDRNPIHLSALSAKLFGFPRAIAHGMWSLARSLAFFEGDLPDAGTADVRFKLPILLPATVALRTEAVRDGERAVGLRFDLAGRRDGRPHLAGSVTT